MESPVPSPPMIECPHCGSTERARNGRCRRCKQAYDRLYNASAGGRARNARYDETAAGIRRKIKYDIARGREKLDIQLSRLEEREAYERSGSHLSFLEWLEQEHPLPRLPPLR